MKERERVQKLRNEERLLQLKEEMKDIEEKAKQSTLDRQKIAHKRALKIQKQITRRAEQREKFVADTNENLAKVK